MKYKLPCGCQFDIIDETVKENDGIPSIDIDFYNLPEDCPATWQLLQTGHTKGVFQLETNLGRKWSKELLPENIEEMSALIALLRPGCLKSMIGDKSMTQLYCDRKNDKDDTTYFHESLEPILKDTYAVLCFQEQSILIAKELAGFNMQEADILRRGIGHKDAKIIAELEQKFIDGCKTVGIVTEQESKEIFGWIREGQKYLFNKSHSVGYSIIGYWTAYIKTHFPLHFYTAWLYFAHEKQKPQQEMQLLISDARYFDIAIKPPTLTNLEHNNNGRFTLYDGDVYFGIGDIKKIGTALVKRIINNAKIAEDTIGRTIDKWTWNDFLIYFSDTVSSTAVTGLINSGATDYMDGSRTKKIAEYQAWKSLTAKEREYAKLSDKKCDNIINVLYDIMDSKPRLSVTRKAKIDDYVNNLKKSPFSLVDDVYYIATHEAELLGVPITCTKLDTCSNIQADTTCKEFLQGKTGKMTIGVEIIDVNEYIIKKGKSKGQKMLFIIAEDNTASIDSIVVFPSALYGNEPILICGSTVLLSGKSDKNGDSFVVERVMQI